MSSLRVTSVPTEFDARIPKEILEAIVGDSIGLCSPQNVIHVGGESMLGENHDISEFHDSLPVCFQSFFEHIKHFHPGLLPALETAFPNQLATSNGTILLFHKSCCEYEP